MKPLEAENISWFGEELQPHESAIRHWLHSQFFSVDVDDVMQETYLRVFRAKKANKIRVPMPRAYLYTTARNVAIDYFRHERSVIVERVPEIGSLPELDNRLNGAETAKHEEDLSLLAEAIQTLPSRCREVLVLRKLHGVPQKQIAARLGITENTVAAQAGTGMRRCIQFFRERGAIE
jgi:RNA polymerase sigma-70 factor (ECF subfamily)